MEASHKCHQKLKTIAELKKVLQVISDSLPHGPMPIDKAIRVFNATKAYVAAEGGHYEHSQ